MIAIKINDEVVNIRPETCFGLQGKECIRFSLTMTADRRLNSCEIEKLEEYILERLGE